MLSLQETRCAGAGCLGMEGLPIYEKRRGRKGRRGAGNREEGGSERDVK